MKHNFQTGDLVKLRGISGEGVPIGLITGLFGTDLIKVKWSNLDLSTRWALPNVVPSKKIEKVELS